MGYHFSSRWSQELHAVIQDQLLYVLHRLPAVAYDTSDQKVISWVYHPVKGSAAYGVLQRMLSDTRSIVCNQSTVAHPQDSNLPGAHDEVDGCLHSGQLLELVQVPVDGGFSCPSTGALTHRQHVHVI